MGVIGGIPFPNALFLCLLEQHFLHPADLGFEELLLGLFRELDHPMAALFLHLIGHLAGSVIRSGTGPAGIGKHVDFRESDLFRKRQGRLEFLLCLPWQIPP